MACARTRDGTPSFVVAAAVAAVVLPKHNENAELARRHAAQAQGTSARLFVESAIRDQYDGKPQKAAIRLMRSISEDESISQEVVQLFVDVGQDYMDQNEEDKAKDLFQKATNLNGNLNIDPEAESGYSMPSIGSSLESSKVLQRSSRIPRFVDSEADVKRAYYEWWCISSLLDNPDST